MLYIWWFCDFGYNCQIQYTVNGERFARLNFCGFEEYRESFPVNIQLQLNNKYCWPRYPKSIPVKNFTAETANVQPSESFSVYGKPTLMIVIVTCIMSVNQAVYTPYYPVHQDKCPPICFTFQFAKLICQICHVYGSQRSLEFSCNNMGIKWKEQQERCFKLEVPKITSVLSPLLVQTRSDIIPTL